MAFSIQHFYKAKNIFLTGGTGTMGIITVEKLLRSFPDIGSIYMLVRPKDGMTVEERKRTYFDNIVFDRLKSEQNIENFSRKLHWVEGDIYKKNLGISEENKKKLQKIINLIIHGAAEISFMKSMKSYVLANIRATYDLLKIAQGCTELSGFAYISTAFCQIQRGQYETPEKILKSNINPLEMIEMAERLSSKELEDISKKNIDGWLSQYSYSKNCAENVCGEFEGRFPIVIFRPAIIGHTYNEPKPYYIAKNLGFPRALMEAHRGFVLHCDPRVTSHMVPADFNNNALLAVMSTMHSNKELKIYNCTTDKHPCPASDAFRYYSSSIPDYEHVLVPHRYRLMEMHDAPSGSPENKMRRRIRQFHYFFDEIGTVCAYNILTFENDNLYILWDQMSEDEKTLLPFDVRLCDWRKYFSNMAANEYGTDVPKFDDLQADPQKRQDIRKTFIYKSKY